MSPLLLNILMYFAGPLVILIGAYWMGHRQANKNSRIDQLEAEKELQSKVNQAERENQQVETKRHEEVEKVRSANNDDELISMWKRLWGPKD